MYWSPGCRAQHKWVYFTANYSTLAWPRLTTIAAWWRWPSNDSSLPYSLSISKYLCGAWLSWWLHLGRVTTEYPLSCQLIQCFSLHYIKLISMGSHFKVVLLTLLAHMRSEGYSTCSGVCLPVCLTSYLTQYKVMMFSMQHRALLFPYRCFIYKL